MPYYCCPSTHFKWVNKIPIGMIKDDEFVSELFKLDDLYYRALKYTEWWVSEVEHQTLLKEVSQRFMADGWAVPLTHIRGEMSLLLREKNYVYLVSQPITEGSS